MKYAERLHRRRCIGLRIAFLFAIVLAASEWGDWPVMAVVVAGGLLAIGAYWRDCRRSRTESSQPGTHTRDS